MITLSKSGNSVTFTFDENSGYLQNGTIDVPVNSLALITDESDMATFRKSASNDIFISARYEEFGMSKAELEAWYKANMVSSSGGGGTGGTTPEEVQQMIDSSISGKTDTSAFTAFSGDVQSTLDEIETVAGAAFNDLNDRMAEKLDASAYTPVDLSDYYTTAQTDSKISEAVSGKQDTLTAGRGIDISANTISFDLPISAGTGTNSLIMSGSGNTASGDYSVAYGKLNSASGECSTANGNRNTANNFAEFSIGQKNVSRTEDSSAFGHSGNTLFSVGNGIINEEQGIDANHNAFEIRGNGEIYISDTNAAGSYYQKPMINLQNTLNGKQDTLVSGTNIKTINNISLLGSGNIDIQGGGGTGTCTVDETTIYDIYSGRYDNSGYELKVRYVVLNYTEDKTVASNINVSVQFRDDSYNYYVNQAIYLDYTTSSYTLSDQSQAEYIDITYDPTIEDFKIAVASAYTSTVFVNYISDFWGNYIKVPFYTISSGSPCTVIENDIPNVVSEIREGLSEAIKSTNITSQKSTLNCYSQAIGGGSNTFVVKLDEIDGSNNTLKPDIYVGLGTSGWTEINLTEQCNANNLKATKYRVTYDYSEFNAFNMNLQLTVEYAGNQGFDYVTFDDQTQLPSLQAGEAFSAATIDWNATTKELVITYPTTIEWYGDQVPVNIVQIYSNNCQFGQTIIKLESYGEDKQALKPYVQETRAALGGLSLVKLTQVEYDALVTKDSNTLYVIVN